MVNPTNLFAQSIPRPPLPGEVWSFTKDEVHCFAMELERLGGYLDRNEPGASHWINAIEAALKSGVSTTNSTPELFAFANGHVAAARRHLSLLVPHDGSDTFQLRCEHNADEHLLTMQRWVECNIEATEFRRATLVRVWDLSPEEKLYGKQFRARLDMEREIDEKIAADNRGVVGFHDIKARDILILEGRPLDEVEELLDDMRRTRERDTRMRLIEEYEKLYRILE